MWRRRPDAILWGRTVCALITALAFAAAANGQEYCAGKPPVDYQPSRCKGTLDYPQLPKDSATLKAAAVEWLRKCTVSSRAETLIDASNLWQVWEDLETVRKVTGDFSIRVTPKFHWEPYQESHDGGTRTCHRAKKISFVGEPDACAWWPPTPKHCQSFPMKGISHDYETFRKRLRPRLDVCADPTEFLRFYRGSLYGIWSGVSSRDKDYGIGDWNLFPTYSLVSEKRDGGRSCLNPVFQGFVSDVEDPKKLDKNELIEKALPLAADKETKCVLEHLERGGSDLYYGAIKPHRLGYGLGMVRGFACWTEKRINYDDKRKETYLEFPPGKAVKECESSFVDEITRYTHVKTKDKDIVRHLARVKNEIDLGIAHLIRLRKSDQGALWTPATTAVCEAVQRNWRDGGIYECFLGKRKKMSCR